MGTDQRNKPLSYIKTSKFFLSFVAETYWPKVSMAENAHIVSYVNSS